MCGGGEWVGSIGSSKGLIFDSAKDKKTTEDIKSLVDTPKIVKEFDPSDITAQPSSLSDELEKKEKKTKEDE